MRIFTTQLPRFIPTQNVGNVGLHNHKPHGNNFRFSKPSSRLSHKRSRCLNYTENTPRTLFLQTTPLNHIDTIRSLCYTAYSIFEKNR